jgi:hypothetical protein
VSAARKTHIGGLVVVACLAGCSSPPPPPPAEPVAKVYPSIDSEIYRRAETERADRLAAEVQRLRADLRQAEEALVMAESGLRGTHSRADAVSSLAEARIQVERAAKATPWREEEIAEARAKLEEAARQIDLAHFGAALFFVYRAERSASMLEGEAAQVQAAPDVRYIRAKQVNLRAGPSTAEPILAVLRSGTPVHPESQNKRWVLVRTAQGALGWVHGSLLGMSRTR